MGVLSLLPHARPYLEPPQAPSVYGKNQTLVIRWHGERQLRAVSEGRPRAARFLPQKQLAPIDLKFTEIQEERQEQNLTSDFGLVLNVTSEPGYPLSYGRLEKAPTKKTLGIALLNVRHENTELGEVTHAAIFVPHGQLKALEKKNQRLRRPLQG